MYKIGIIDDDDAWSNFFIRNHRDLFKDFDVEPFKVTLVDKMPLGELINIIKQENLAVIFLDENLAELKALSFQGHEIVSQMRISNIYRPVYYFTNKTTTVEQEDIFKMCDGIFDKAKINNKKHDEYAKFRKEFSRIIQKGKDFIDEEKKMVQRLNYLSMEIAKGNPSEEMMDEYQMISDKINESHLYEHSSERANVLKNIEKQVEELERLIIKKG